MVHLLDKLMGDGGMHYLAILTFCTALHAE